jgi:hypothetical protein
VLCWEGVEVIVATFRQAPPGYAAHLLLPHGDGSVASGQLSISSCSTNSSAAANSGCFSLSSLRTYRLFSRACSGMATAIILLLLTTHCF